ncbi:hypothetical protein ATK86_1453 [Nocardia fluminea]|uniref:Uncharacterized protein n=1 Tax=Nocardia fluminea TaxID=134984 RepID=A0A2N3V680_9NOCA|nr:hypothetical protein ATK86_1453 [Nocardia fluminea]
MPATGVLRRCWTMGMGMVPCCEPDSVASRQLPSEERVDTCGMCSPESSDALRLPRFYVRITQSMAKLGALQHRWVITGCGPARAGASKIGRARTGRVTASNTLRRRTRHRPSAPMGATGSSMALPRRSAPASRSPTASAAAAPASVTAFAVSTAVGHRMSWPNARTSSAHGEVCIIARPTRAANTAINRASPTRTATPRCRLCTPPG